MIVTAVTTMMLPSRMARKRISRRSSGFPGTRLGAGAGPSGDAAVAGGGLGVWSTSTLETYRRETLVS